MKTKKIVVYYRPVDAADAEETARALLQWASSRQLEIAATFTDPPGDPEKCTRRGLAKLMRFCKEQGIKTVVAACLSDLNTSPQEAGLLAAQLDAQGITAQVALEDRQPDEHAIRLYRGIMSIVDQMYGPCCMRHSRSIAAREGWRRRRAREQANAVTLNVVGG